jgi:type IV secretion system protein VirD4
MAAPTPFKFGYHVTDEQAGAVDRNAPVLYPGERHILLFGVNGAGKSTRILIENLACQLRNRSLVVFDIKGELAAQTMRARARLGDDVKLVNPHNLHNMGSHGFNPLALLDPDDDEFFDQAKELTLAVIESHGEDSKNEFFTLSSRGWFCAGIMWEVVQARREGRTPSLLRAREWCLQPDEWKELPLPVDGKMLKIQTAGITFNAKRMGAEGGQQIASLAGRFAAKELSKSDHDVIKTLDAQTEFLISNPIARDLEKGSWSFAQLKQRPTTVFVVLPANQIQDKRGWTRMLLTCALHEHLKPGPLKTLFIMDEFRVSIGHLPIVNDFWALVRGHGVQFMPVCQSVLQLRALFRDEWENYAGQAGAVATIGPPGDTATAEWMSKRAGTTTIWQRGFSEGAGTSASGSSSNMGETRSQAERAFRLPQELMNMPLGFGRLWLAGMGDRSLPFYAPNYWQRAEIKPLVDENPYHRSATQSAARASSFSAAPAAPSLGPSRGSGNVVRLRRPAAARKSVGSADAAPPGLAIVFAIGCIFAAYVVASVAYEWWSTPPEQPHKQKTHTAVNPSRK